MERLHHVAFAAVGATPSEIVTAAAHENDVLALARQERLTDIAAAQRGRSRIAFEIARQQVRVSFRQFPKQHQQTLV